MMGHFVCLAKEPKLTTKDIKTLREWQLQEKSPILYHIPKKHPENPCWVLIPPVPIERSTLVESMSILQSPGFPTQALVSSSDHLGHCLLHLQSAR